MHVFVAPKLISAAISMHVVPRVGAKALGNATGVRMIPKGSQGSYKGGVVKACDIPRLPKHNGGKSQGQKNVEGPWGPAPHQSKYASSSICCEYLPHTAPSMFVNNLA